MVPTKSSFIMEDGSGILVFLQFPKKIDVAEFDKKLVTCVKSCGNTINISKCQVISGLTPEKVKPIISAMTSDISASYRLVFLGSEQGISGVEKMPSYRLGPAYQERLNDLLSLLGKKNP